MTFNIGDKVVRKKLARNEIWETHCANANISPYSDFVITDIHRVGNWLMVEGINKTWNIDCFVLAESVTTCEDVTEISEKDKFIDWILKYRHSMSYNDSYFGEPSGMLKGWLAELDRNPIQPVKSAHK